MGRRETYEYADLIDKRTTKPSNFKLLPHFLTVCRLCLFLTPHFGLLPETKPFFNHFILFNPLHFYLKLLGFTLFRLFPPFPSIRLSNPPF